MTAQATAVETKQRPWWLMLIEGIALFVIAAVLLWAPIKTRVNTYMLLVQLLGLYWVIQGIFNIVAMFMDHSGWGWKLFIGIVSIIAGGYILMYPIATGLVLPQIFVLMLGIWGLMEGIVLLQKPLVAFMIFINVSQRCIFFQLYDLSITGPLDRQANAGLFQDTTHLIDIFHILDCDGGDDVSKARNGSNKSF